MSNYDPYKPASDGQSGYQPSAPAGGGYQQPSEPAYQAPQVSEAPAYQPSSDGWQSGAASSDSSYNPNGYASSYQAYSPAGGGYSPSSASAGGTNILAIFSLVASLVGFFFIWYLGPVAGIVLAHLARKQIRETGENGSGLATAGWWVGWVGIVLQVLFAIGWVLLFVLAAAAGTSEYAY